MMSESMPDDGEQMPPSQEEQEPMDERPAAIVNAPTKLLRPLPGEGGSDPALAGSADGAARRAQPPSAPPTDATMALDAAQGSKGHAAAEPEPASKLEVVATLGQQAQAIPQATAREKGEEQAASSTSQGRGLARFFWLEELAFRIAEGIEGPLRAAPAWQAATGRTSEKRRAVRAQAQAFLDQMPGISPFQTGEEKELVLRLVEDEALGYGPLDPLLTDERVSEIMVVAPALVYVERLGKVVEAPIRFQHEAHLMRVIEALLRPLGRSVNRAWPMAEGRLPDGSRVNVVIPPAAVKGPTLTIRKFILKPLSLEDLVRLGALNAQMAEFLEASVRARLNMVVSGETGAGKTTLLHALGACIPAEERIVTIEEAAELRLPQRHVVALETASADPDGSGRVTMRDLVAQALRMRPSRMIIGECRGGEALELLQAMNTGHDGLLMTAYATSSRDCLARLETMALMAGLDVSALVMRQQVAGALQIGVHLARLRDGSRKVTQITEIQGIDGEMLLLQDLFRFRETGTDAATGNVQGVFEPGGVRPKCSSRFEALNMQFPPEFFGQEERPHGPKWEPAWQ